jgi:putative MATE family efflux protein
MSPCSPAVTGSAIATRTLQLVEAPVTPTLLRLAMPNVVVMVAQAAVSTCEMYFIGWLGPEALAGAALVFPLIMLMQTMSAGGMGGGVASAVARALGAGRRHDANALVFHALVIAGAMGMLFTTGALWGGPALYRAMGGEGESLVAARTYSHVVFTGAMSFWLFNTLASVVRGAGNMLLPASLVVGGGALTLALSPLLIAGWGPVPSLGIAGAGVALLVYYSLGSVVLLVYLSGGKSLVRLTIAGQRLQGALFCAILRVGLPASLNTMLTNLNVAVLTSLVGPFGTFALAGYGLGARLEYLQIPLVFGFGSALVTMVSTNIGAGRIARAQRIAWIGAGLAAAITGSVGLFGACFPGLWLGLFSTHPEVLGAGAAYLRLVGPTYGCFGLGLALYFASQGAGRLLWPLVAGGTRLAIAAGGSWLASAWFGSSLTAIYIAIAAAFVIYAAIMVAAIKARDWQDMPS